MKRKYHSALDKYERQILVNSLNNLRNGLISEGKYTDGVDDLLIKVITAKTKKYKVSYKEN